MSKETWNPIVPSLTISRASFITLAILRSSMSRIVKTWTPDSRTICASVASRLRTPTRAHFSGRTIGTLPPIRARRRGSFPRTEAKGIPWTFPLGEDSGEFMSPCASNQSRPISPPRARASAEDAAIDPTAIEWSPPRVTGIARLPWIARIRAYSISQTRATSLR
jgi:hypothetical protein